MKNKFFTIILSILLSLPIMVWAVDNEIITAENEDTPVVNTLDEEPSNQMVVMQKKNEPAALSPEERMAEACNDCIRSF